MNKQHTGRRRQAACRRFYSMIEMALAIGVVAVGMISVLALFPVGLDANRDAVAESYAADAADMFLNFFAQSLKSDPTVWTTFAALPTTKPPADVLRVVSLGKSRLAAARPNNR